MGIAAVKMIDPDQSKQSEPLQITSNEKISIQCGKSLIELLPDGKIILKGRIITQQAEENIKLCGDKIELN